MFPDNLKSTFDNRGDIFFNSHLNTDKLHNIKTRLDDINIAVANIAKEPLVVFVRIKTTINSKICSKSPEYVARAAFCVAKSTTLAVERVNLRQKYAANTATTK